MSQVLVRNSMNGFVLYPEDWPEKCNPSIVCDMLIGPCACGAWHVEEEQWVQDALKLMNASIKDE